MGMNGSQGIVEGCMPTAHKGISLVGFVGNSHRIYGDLESIYKNTQGECTDLYFLNDLSTPIGHLNPDGSYVFTQWCQFMDAYLEGVEAALLERHGEETDGNPYEDGSSDNKDWNRGYDETK